jgi:hypothetical protein
VRSRLASGGPPGPDRRAGVSRSIGLLAPISVVAALGVFCVALADAAARGSDGSQQTFFWIGIVLIVLPTVIRLCSAEATRTERVGLVVVFGLALYLTKVTYSPSRLTFSDEFVEVRTVLDILRTGHLFHFNPLLPVSSSYPGLPDVAVGLVRLTGLPVSTAAILVLGSARIVLMLAIFAIIDRLSGSARLAGLAACLYAANPNFLYWSSQFDYESLALPLFGVAIFLVLVRSRREKGFALDLLCAASVLAVVITHHLTSYLLAGVLLIWAIVAFWVGRDRPDARRPYAPIGLAMLALAAIGFWLIVVAGSTNEYLGSIASNAGNGLLGTITGSSSTRALFTSGTEVAPFWERALSIVAVGLTMLALVLGALAIWRRRMSRPAMIPVLALALAYPLLLPLRLIGSAAETANRSTEFLYLGLSAVIAAVVFWPRASWRDGTGARVTAGLLCSVIIFGGVAVSWQYSTRLPQDSEAAAVPYELSPQAIDVDRWSRESLGPGHRFAADILSRLGLATYGEQRPLYAPRDGISSWQVMAPEHVDPAVRQAIREGEVEFVLVERKLHDGIPTAGYYFDRGEPMTGLYRHPISIANLEKFEGAAGVSLIYDNGTQQIFAVGRAR